MALTDRQQNILKLVFQVGGYVTPHIISVRFECDSNRARRQLKRLEKAGYIGQRKIFAGANKQSVYQIKKKGADFCGVPDSYARKRHSEGHILRVLGKATWFIREPENVLLQHAHKLEFWKKRWPDRRLPLYDYRNGQKPQLPELLRLAEGCVEVIVFDRPDASPSSQIRSLTRQNRYGEYVKEIEGGELKFRLIIYDDERAAAWREAISRQPEVEQDGAEAVKNRLAEIDKLIRSPHVPIDEKRAILKEQKELKEQAKHTPSSRSKSGSKIFKPIVQIIYIDQVQPSVSVEE